MRRPRRRGRRRAGRSVARLNRPDSETRGDGRQDGRLSTESGHVARWTSTQSLLGVVIGRSGRLRENTNGLLRQYLPRGTDFSRISQSYLNAIALRLNQRPRKTLGFQTPADRLQAVLH